MTKIEGKRMEIVPIALSTMQNEISNRDAVPCEHYHPESCKHPRYPSGWCVVCGVPPESGCRFVGKSCDFDALMKD